MLRPAVTGHLRRHSGIDDRLIGLGALTSVLAYVIWAALHDIAQQLEASYQAEAGALLFAVPAQILVTKAALKLVGPAGRKAWASAMLLWIALLCLAAANSMATSWSRTGNSLEIAVVVAGLVAALPLLRILFRR